METVAPKKNKLKPVYLLAIVIAVAAVAGIVYIVMSGSGGSLTIFQGIGAPTVVQAGDNISVYYIGSYANGTVFNSNIGKQPLNFTVGAGQLIAGFENGVVGMGLNQTKNITVQPSQGYGFVNQSLIISVPRTDFGNQSLSLGLAFKISTGQQGIITAINATNVTVDFNPPLAGKTLMFQIRVVSIKK
jgi:FKBP-type peptidyl-prolyl cis-trans isomerase 2